MEIINYPEGLSSREIQAGLWSKLVQSGLDARLEVTPHIKGKRGVRLDVVVFKNRKAVCIVECKSWSKSYARNYKYRKAHNTRQVNRYKAYFGLPVFVCGFKSAIEPLSKIIYSVTYP